MTATVPSGMNPSHRFRRVWQRAVNLFTALGHFARWSWQFGEFGFRSRVIAPVILTNSSRIRIGKRVSIWRGARIEALAGSSQRGAVIDIGDDTIIHLNFHCGAADSVRIGKAVLIAGGVYISDHDHVYDDAAVPARWHQALVSKPVVIGDGVWLGEGCVILKGVTIGDRAVVGANAVVTRDVPPGVIVAGVPAKVLKRISFR